MIVLNIEDLCNFIGEMQWHELLRTVAMLHDIGHSEINFDIVDGLQRLEPKLINQKFDTVFQNQDSLDDIIHSFDLSKINVKDKKDIGFDYFKKCVNEVEKETSDTEELKSDINDIFLESENWQVVFKEKFEKWSEKNPLFSGFLVIILISILINIASDLVTDAITNARVGIKNRPTENSDTVVIVPDNATVVIISADNPDENYHKVQYTDPITGDVYEGFISKKSINASPSQINDDVTNTH